MKTEMAMAKRGSSLCSFGIILYFLLNLNRFIFPTAGYVLQDCRVTRGTLAICRNHKVFPYDLPTGVTSIDLSGNSISKLNNADLKNFTNLLLLNLRRNSVSRIEPGTFASQTSLEVLNLNSNRLGFNLQEGMFEGLVNLKELYLASNAIRTLAPASFKSLRRLTFLDLGRNKLRNLTNILKHVPRLQTLNVPANRISHFHSWELSNTSTELLSLNLSLNRLQVFSLTADIFPNLKSLELENDGGKKIRILWEVSDASYLSGVSELDVSGVRASPGLREVLETFNSSLAHLRLNHMRDNLRLLVNISCKIPSLTSLDLRENSIRVARSEMPPCANLTKLDLGRNKISIISDNSFRSLKKLNILIIKYNRLTLVPSAIRKTKISKVDLSFNNIRVLGCDDFANMTRLKILQLNNNNLSALGDCVFKDLVKLEHLRLQNNYIYKLNGAFKENFFPNLRVLYLSNNQLGNLEFAQFKALNSLQKLSLGKNTIQNLNKGNFKGLTNLQSLALHSNEIVEINDGALDDLKALKTLNLMTNHLRYRSEGTVSKPPFAKLSQLHTLLISAQRRRLKGALPQNFLEGLTNLSVLDIRSTQLVSLHPLLFSHTPNLKVLYLSANDFMRLPDDLFSPIPKLKSLYVSRLNLRSLDFLLRADLAELEFLQARKNAFSVIREPAMLSLPALTYLDLRGNSFTCDCDNGWFVRWATASERTQVSDARRFECNYPPVLEGTKLLEFDVGSCAVDAGFAWFVSTACAVVAAAAAPFAHRFLRWRLVYAYYLTLAFLYNSRRRRRHGDRGERAHRYDAFVSYNANDEAWVLGQLLPELEDRQGWRLCLHHRDFLPGKAIMENITDAIYGSRKTICVVTRDYLESEWCSREIQIASFRLFDERKDVLILVFLEDIPVRQLSPYYRMRKLLSRRTYLSWRSHGDAGAVADADADADAASSQQQRRRRLVFWEKLRQALDPAPPHPHNPGGEHPMGEHLLRLGGVEGAGGRAAR